MWYIKRYNTMQTQKIYSVSEHCAVNGHNIREEAQLRNRTWWSVVRNPANTLLIKFVSVATSLFSIVCGGQLQVTYFRRLGQCTHMWFISSNMADHVYHPTRFNNIQYDRLSICFQYVSSFFTLKLNRTIITSTLSSLPPPPLSRSEFAHL